MSSYRDLIVWQKSYSLTLFVHTVSKKFPKEELFNVVSQVRRSALSTPSNTAEGNHRGSKKEHVQFFRIAFASGAEIETQLLLSKDLKYITEKEFEDASQLLGDVMRMLSKLIKSFSGVGSV